MKKFSIKKLVIFLCLPLLLVGGVCSGILLSKNNENTANAVIEYVDSSKYLNPLFQESDPVPSFYQLSSDYPLMSENQTDSDLCWIYSSQKVLESSLMKQRNLYHNFSEIGMALLNYVNYTLKDDSISVKKINTTGDFTKYNILAQNLGLIYENTFSNDIYYDINEDNYEDYLYALAHSDKSIMDNVKPINIHDYMTTALLSSEQKQELIKKYILKYGGVFAGIEQGIISNATKIYRREINPSRDNEYDGYIGLNHAVCIVGWKDDLDCGTNGTGAFYVMNSWGVSSTSYNYFWVPYSYTYLYSDTYGYICEEDKNAVQMIDSSVNEGTTFNSKFLTAGKVLDNLFLYGQNVELTYQINDELNFDRVFVNIYHGTSNVTNDFSIDFNDDEKIITISSNNKENLGEGYLIEFFNDDEFLASKDFYVFTGTEVSYIQLSNDDIHGGNIVLFNNNLASSTFEQTYYIYDNIGNNYYLDFYYPSLGSLTYDRVVFTIGEIKNIYTDDNGEVQEKILNNQGLSGSVFVTKEQDQSTISNRSRIKISNLTIKTAGQIVEINISVKSKDSVGTGKTQNYKFMFIISTDVNANTKTAGKIIYELDGGTNNAKNINRYPVFENETSMTKFKLYSPTKATSTFMGWFTDSKFENPITEIDSTLTGDIVIYAKWESKDAEYFFISFGLSDIISYDGTSNKYVGQDIIYGNSVNSLFTFAPELEHLQTYKYSTIYEYYFNNTLVSTKVLDSSGENITIENQFLDNDKIKLVCGTYNLRIVVTMLVSHQFSKTKELELSFSVKPKQVTAKFDENTLEYVYDKKGHIPVVSSFDGVFDKDEKLFYTLDEGEKIDVGTYSFKVNSISNSNYYIDDNQTCTLKISAKEITITWDVISVVYNGVNQLPTYEFNGVIDGDSVQATLGLGNTVSDNFDSKNVGEYDIRVVGISNSNYKLIDNNNCTFVISKAKIKIVLEDVMARFTLAPINRPRVGLGLNAKVEGTVYPEYDSNGKEKTIAEILNFTCSSNGISATECGDYPIIAECSNPNYDVEIGTATYKILGFYYVFYTLPDGTEYREMVNEGETPKGITKDIYKKPFLSKLVYSEELVGNGETDLYIKVTVKSYAWIFYVSIVIIGFIVVYRIAGRKERQNKMR